MNIPNDYDPVAQEEGRQALADKRAEHFPICGCCGHYLYGGERFWTLNRIREEIIVCGDCRQEMEGSVCTVEDLRYA